MVYTLHDTTTYATAYMDDVIIYSQSWEQHLQHIRNVLDRLKKANLTVNPSKCVWGGKTMNFLGHAVGEGKMSLPDHRVAALAEYDKPTTKRGLRAFLGSVGFYRRYARQLASQTAVLTPHTAKQAPSRVLWDEKGELVFKEILSIMSNTTSLLYTFTPRHILTSHRRLWPGHWRRLTGQTRGRMETCSVLLTPAQRSIRQRRWRLWQ